MSPWHSLLAVGCKWYHVVMNEFSLRSRFALPLQSVNGLAADRFLLQFAIDFLRLGISDSSSSKGASFVKIGTSEVIIL